MHYVNISEPYSADTNTLVDQVFAALALSLWQLHGQLEILKFTVALHAAIKGKGYRLSSCRNCFVTQRHRTVEEAHSGLGPDLYRAPVGPCSAREG